MSNELQIAITVIGMLLGAFVLYEFGKRLHESVPADVVQTLANLTSEALKQAQTLAERTTNPLDDYAVTVVRQIIERDKAGDVAKPADDATIKTDAS